jgi:hypothetical protein
MCFSYLFVRFHAFYETGLQFIFLVMPGLVPGIHVLAATKEDVDGRVKPGHDGLCVSHQRTQITSRA